MAKGKIKKLVTVTLSFSVEVDEDTIPLSDDPDARNYNSRQRRLLQAILSSEKNLNAYTLLEITSLLEGMHWRDWYRLLLNSDDVSFQSILAPVIETLDVSDQDFFHEVDARGIFTENVEMTDECFSSELTNVVVVVEEGE